jgi:protein-S-isoprenylcysteine O-methyltransferase Ste14
MLRHLRAILLLPFLVVAVIPFVLLNTLETIDWRWDFGSGPVIGKLSLAAGVAVIMLGLGLFGWCVRLFARVGDGTLAPWDPTRNIVATGPYRYVRNPMISGVALMLIGETLLWGSWVLGLWACVFIGINHVYFMFAEEPGLEKRFGESYRRYKADVPRWFFRRRP